MGDSIGNAAVEKAQAVRVEADRHGDAVAAIAVEQERGGAIAGQALAENDGYGQLGAVGGGGVQSFDGISPGIVASEYGLLLPQDALPAGQVEVEHRARGNKGFVGVAEVGLVELGIGAGSSVIGGFAEGDAVGGGQKIR